MSFHEVLKHFQPEWSTHRIDLTRLLDLRQPHIDTRNSVCSTVLHALWLSLGKLFEFCMLRSEMECLATSNSMGKMNVTYMLGFGLVSGVVKVFPVSSLSLARKSTRKKRVRRARMTKWDLKSHDRLLVGPDRTWAIARELAGACDRSSDRESRR